MRDGYRDQAGPLAIAHRGGAGLAPENTLEAFRRSHALGLRCLETDVRVTADGELVAFHDATLRRVLGVPGRVATRTLDQLRSLSMAGTCAVLPVSELLAAFPDSRFIVDVKERAAVEPLAELLRDTGAAHRICAAGAWDFWLAELRERTGPELTTALSWRALTALVMSSHAARIRSPRGTRVITAADAAGGYAHVPIRLGRVPVFVDDLVARAHGIGVRVIVWTVNDATAMHRLLDVHVDGIITDRPDLLREVLIARGQWHAPEGVRYRAPA